MVKKQHEQKLNNAGFSLVELIVSILITGFITGMLVAFLTISRRTYESINTEAVLQTEASMASNYINELLIEAQAFESGEFTYTKGGITGDASVIWIKAPDNSSASRATSCDYFIIHEKSSGILRFCKQESTDADMVLKVKNTPGDIAIVNTAIEDRYALLAEYVTSIKLAKVSGTKDLMSMELNLDYAGKPYTTTLYVSARNLQR